MSPTRVDIPLEPFRERYLQLTRERGYSATELAFKAGYLNRRLNRPDHGDSSRLLRALGLRPDTRRVDRENLPTHTTYETAVRLCRALDMDPVDAGV